MLLASLDIHFESINLFTWTLNSSSQQTNLPAYSQKWFPISKCS